MGETIHQEATVIDMCPFKSLARVVHIILQDGGTTDTLLYAYKCSGTWEHIQSADMIVVVHTVTKQLKLLHQVIDPDLVGSHLLRAGGDMALKLHSYDDTTIKKSAGGLALLSYNIFKIK